MLTDQHVHRNKSSVPKTVSQACTSVRKCYTQFKILLNSWKTCWRWSPWTCGEIIILLKMHTQTTSHASTFFLHIIACGFMIDKKWVVITLHPHAAMWDMNTIRYGPPCFDVQLKHTWRCYIYLFIFSWWDQKHFKEVA